MECRGRCRGVEGEERRRRGELWHAQTPTDKEERGRETGAAF